MSSTTSRIYNSTDGPLLIDEEGHVLAARESTRVKSLDGDPIAGHLEAGRLIDTTEAKEDGADAVEVLDEQLVAPAEGDAAKTKGNKPANPTPRS